MLLFIFDVDTEKRKTYDNGVAGLLRPRSDFDVHDGGSGGVYCSKVCLAPATTIALKDQYFG